MDAKITLFTAIGTFLAVVVAIWTLRTNHDWNRRSYAIKLLEDWNTQVAPHRKNIEKLIPGLIDIDPNSQKPSELSKTRASQIYLCTQNSEEKAGDWELRFSIIALLNYFEIIATAWYQHVGDQEMIEATFKNPLIRYETSLKNFIEIVTLKHGFNPWQPYSDLIAEWQRPSRKAAKKTA